MKKKLHWNQVTARLRKLQDEMNDISARLPDFEAREFRQQFRRELGFLMQNNTTAWSYASELANLEVDALPGRTAPQTEGKQ